MDSWLKKLSPYLVKNKTTKNLLNSIPNPSERKFIKRYADSHSVFTKFEPWEGVAPACFNVNPYGSFIRRSFFGLSDYETEKFHKKVLPKKSEEYFEWIDLLESIDSAQESFTMVELGAGHGRWLVQAAVILRNQKNIPFRLVGVEAESNHYKMMHQHFIDNGLNPKEHMLIQAAVTDTDEPVYFTEGHSKEWWGQAVIPTKDTKIGDWPEATVVKVPSISINKILENLDYVDLMDIDIQGAEARAVKSSLSALNAKVRRVHIGTHSHENEENLYKMFSELRWICCNSFPCLSTVETHYGPITFEDGVQTWINPHITAKSLK